MERLYGVENDIKEMGLFQCMFQSTMDLVCGHIVSRTSEAIFSHSWSDLWLGKDTNNSKSLLLKKGTRVWLQMAFTVILSYELRNLYANNSGLVDPLGGLMFIIGVGQQPKFWERMNDLSKSVYNLLIDNSDLSSTTDLSNA